MSSQAVHSPSRRGETRGPPAGGAPAVHSSASSAASASADHHRPRVAQMARPRDLERALVARPGLARAAPRHRHRPRLEVDMREIGRAPRERSPRAPRPFDGVVERRLLVVGDAHPEAEHAAQQRVGVRRVRHGGRAGNRRHDPVPVGGAAAHVQQALDEDVVELQRPVVAALAVAREAGGLGRRGVVEALRARHVARRGERHAAHQRHARVPRQHLGAQQRVDRAKRLQALLEPQPEPARALRDPPEQLPIARLRRMAQRLDEPRAARERSGDAAVDRPIALRILLEPPLLAVVPDQRVQTHRRSAPRARQESRERRNRRDPPSRVARARHLVHERRLDRVEQSHVEHELAVLGRDAAPQPRLDPVRDRAVRAPGARLPAPPGVAVDAKRKRPARGILDHRRQLPA